MADKFLGGVRQDQTDVTIAAFFRSLTDNSELTGLLATDINASYWRQGGSRVAITASDLTAVDDPHSDGGFFETDTTNMPGLYRFDVPDAAFAAGADWVVVTITATGAFVYVERFNITKEVPSLAEISSLDTIQVISEYDNVNIVQGTLASGSDPATAIKTLDFSTWYGVDADPTNGISIDINYSVGTSGVTFDKIPFRAIFQGVYSGAAGQIMEVRAYNWQLNAYEKIGEIVGVTSSTKDYAYDFYLAPEHTEKSAGGTVVNINLQSPYTAGTVWIDYFAIVAGKRDSAKSYINKVDSNLATISGSRIDNNSAELHLKQLTVIQNAAGADAVKFQNIATDSNGGVGLRIQSDDGNAVLVVSGPTANASALYVSNQGSGNAFRLRSADGHALDIQSGGAGDAIHVSAPEGIALLLQNEAGNTHSCFYINQLGDANAVRINAGGASGDGINITTVDGHGISVDGQGVGKKDIYAPDSQITVDLAGATMIDPTYIEYNVGTPDAGNNDASLQTFDPTAWDWKVDGDANGHFNVGFFVQDVDVAPDEIVIGAVASVGGLNGGDPYYIWRYNNETGEYSRYKKVERTAQWSRMFIPLIMEQERHITQPLNYYGFGFESTADVVNRDLYVDYVKFIKVKISQANIVAQALKMDGNLLAINGNPTNNNTAELNLRLFSVINETPGTTAFRIEDRANNQDGAVYIRSNDARAVDVHTLAGASAALEVRQGGTGLDISAPNSDLGIGGAVGVPVSYAPTSATRVVGDDDGGDYTNLASRDDTSMVTGEDATNGLEVIVALASSPPSEVPSLARVCGRYGGPQQHQVYIQAYDYTTAGWVTIATMQNRTTNFDYVIPLTSHNHDVGGAMQIRFLHSVTTYNAGDSLVLDYISWEKVSANTSIATDVAQILSVIGTPQDVTVSRDIANLPDLIGGGGGDANLVSIMGNPVDDYSATLRLRQLDIQSPDDVAFRARGGGANPGAQFEGGETGRGLELIGGPTSGDGAMIQAPSSGMGLRVLSSNGNPAIRLAGSGTGEGLVILGGSTADGVVIQGGGTSGRGVRVLTSDGHGVEVTSAGAGKVDILATKDVAITAITYNPDNTYNTITLADGRVITFTYAAGILQGVTYS